MQYPSDHIAEFEFGAEIKIIVNRKPRNNRIFKAWYAFRWGQHSSRGDA